MKHLLKTTAVMAIGALSGWNAHNGGLSNKTKASLLGGVAGGFVGNQFGSGSGNAAATALGAVLGVVAGQSLVQDAPGQHPVYQTINETQFNNIHLSIEDQDGNKLELNGQYWSITLSIHYQIQRQPNIVLDIEEENKKEEPKKK